MLVPGRPATMAPELPSLLPPRGWCPGRVSRHCSGSSWSPWTCCSGCSSPSLGCGCLAQVTTYVHPNQDINFTSRGRVPVRYSMAHPADAYYAGPGGDVKYVSSRPLYPAAGLVATGLGLLVTGQALNKQREMVARIRGATENGPQLTIRAGPSHSGDMVVIVSSPGFLWDYSWTALPSETPVGRSARGKEMRCPRWPACGSSCAGARWSACMPNIMCAGSCRSWRILVPLIPVAVKTHPVQLGTLLTATRGYLLLAIMLTPWRTRSSG